MARLTASFHSFWISVKRDTPPCNPENVILELGNTEGLGIELKFRDKDLLAAFLEQGAHKLRRLIIEEDKS